MRGNPLLIFNKQLSLKWNILVYKSFGNVLSAVYKCTYTRGQWKQACGEEIDMTMSKIKNQFIYLIKTYTPLTVYSDINARLMCDRCKEESNIKVFEHFNQFIAIMLKDLLFDNQSPALYKECHLVDYPLNHCHIKNIWRRDLFNMFCHNVTFLVAPPVKTLPSFV